MHPGLVDEGDVVVVSCPFGEVAWAQKVRSQNRNGGQGYYQRRNQRKANRQGEGQEERPYEALDECKGYENDDSRQGRGEDGRTHLSGRVQRRPPPLPSRLYMTVDVLQYDDGIVHHPSHGDGQAPKGH